MESMATNWLKIELRTYFLIYCANADFDASKEDFDYIASRTDQVVYEKMLKEFSRDSDYQSIQKIQSSVERLNVDKAEIDSFLSQMREMFMEDGRFSELEKTLIMGLKHVLPS
jgi:uncharacterized protein (DUF2225 family)